MIFPSIAMKIKRNKKKLYAIGIFTIVLLFYLLPRSGWGFELDDCGYLYNSKITSLYDLYAMLGKDDHSVLAWPSNYVLHEQSFFNIHYRPFCRLFFVPQVWFFGSWAYGYFFIMILFHAFNAALLFYLATYFVQNYFFAGWIALFFALHRNVGMFMGWIAAQNYPVALMFVLLNLLFIFSRKKNSIVTCITSCFLFLLALFTFEFTLFLPLFMSIFLCGKHFLVEHLGKQWASFRYRFFAAAPLWSALSLFLLTRWFLHPGCGAGGEIGNFWQQRGGRIYADCASLLAELSNVTFIPSGNFLLKSILTGLFFIGVIWLLIHNRYKKSISLLFLGGATALWPALIKPYTSRHSYFALPFFIIGLGLLFYYAFFSVKKLKRLSRKSIVLFLFGILSLNAYQSYLFMDERERASINTAQCYKELVGNPLIKGRVLCFVGIPVRYWTGLAQAIWLQGINEGLPIYYDPLTFTTDSCSGGCPVSIKWVGEDLLLAIKDFYDGWFCDMGLRYRMGKVDKLKYHSNGAPRALLYSIDIVYKEKNMLFITWDYINNKFIVMPDWRQRVN